MNHLGIYPDKICPRFLRLFFLSICTFLLVSACSNHERSSSQWMDERIALDLIATSRIKAEQINRTEQMLRDRGIAFTRIQVASGAVNFITPPLGPIYQSRQEGYKRLFRTMLKSYDLPNVDFIVALDDSFNEQILVGEDWAPVFCIAKLKSQSRVISIPEAYDYPQWDDLYRSVGIADSKFSWKKKIGIAFWRGSTTGGGILSVQNWRDFLRAKIVFTSQLSPQILDCAFTQVVQGTPDVEKIVRSQGLLGKPMNPASQVKYKYLIAADGNSFPGSLKWQLFSGSVVLRNESEWVQWFEEALVPNKHYVPYKSDCSDLVEKVQWLTQNDADAEQIAREAKKFALQNLTSKSVELYVYKLLTAYSHLQSKS